MFLLLQHGWAPVCSMFLSEQFSWSYSGHRSCFIFLSYWRFIREIGCIFKNLITLLLWKTGPEGASFTPSPLPMQSSNSIFDRREAIVNLDVCLNNSSSLDSDGSICQNEHGSTTDGISQTNPTSLPPIRTRRKPPLSEESGVASWHTRYLRREV
jgi:hypothetical protein